jgi:hypothetical protein
MCTLTYSLWRSMRYAFRARPQVEADLGRACDGGLGDEEQAVVVESLVSRQEELQQLLAAAPSPEPEPEPALTIELNAASRLDAQRVLDAVAAASAPAIPVAAVAMAVAAGPLAALLATLGLDEYASVLSDQGYDDLEVLAGKG